MSSRTKTAAAVVLAVRKELSAAANPGKAKEMAAYMKTGMAFYGVQKPMRVQIFKEILKAHPIDRATFEDVILALWREPHREEKYCAINLAQWMKKFVSSESLPLYEKMIREGAWWDFVDAVASDCVGAAQLKERPRVEPVMDRWIEDENMWIRRSAILSQLRHKEKTNEEQLFRYCLKCAREKEFFIRKAIGWALREYARTAPEAVGRFIIKNKDRLSPLSFREAAKHLEMS